MKDGVLFKVPFTAISPNANTIYERDRERERQTDRDREIEREKERKGRNSRRETKKTTDTHTG